MTTIDPSGYSEAGAHLFTWLADKVLGGAKKAFGWEHAQWAKARDRSDACVVKDYGQIRIANQTTCASSRRPDGETAIHECLRRHEYSNAVFAMHTPFP